MDPGEALKRCRAAVEIIQGKSTERSYWGQSEDAATELAEAFAMLDLDLAGGGFLPTEWGKAKAPEMREHTLPLGMGVKRRKLENAGPCKVCNVEAGKECVSPTTGAQMGLTVHAYGDRFEERKRRG